MKTMVKRARRSVNEFARLCFVDPAGRELHQARVHCQLQIQYRRLGESAFAGHAPLLEGNDEAGNHGSIDRGSKWVHARFRGGSSRLPSA